MIETEAPPQIAILSLISDRLRTEPLVKGVRDRGLRVWWDASLDDALVSAEDRMKTAEAALARASIACVLVSGQSLPHLQRGTLAPLQANRRCFVPIRLEPIPADDLPKELTEVAWIDLLKSEDLGPAIDQLERLVKEAESATPRSSSSRPAKPSPPPLRLLLGDSTQSETWAVSEELHHALVVAAQVNRFTSDERDYPISFKSMLLSLFIAPSAAWVQTLAERVGFDAKPLFVAKGLDRDLAPEIAKAALEPGELSEPLRTTGSAAALLQSAREYARRSGARPSLQHVVAALVYNPAGHDRELESYGFDRLVWASALLEEVERQFPRETELFRALRDEAFPITPGPADPAQHHAPDLPNEPGVVSPSVGDKGSTAAPPADACAAADPDLKRAFAWAAAATPLEPGRVGVKELLGGLLKEGGDEGAFAVLLASMAGGQSGPAEPTPWERLHRALDLPVIRSVPLLHSLPPLDFEVNAVLDEALSLRAESDEPLSVTLVFVVLWEPIVAGGRAAIDPLLPRLGVDAEAFLERLHADLAARECPYASIVQNIIQLRRANRPGGRPHVDNDRVGGAISPDRDLLDARKPALRFAKLLAAKDVKPPVALGLFGNWGSGKTFFMGLMQDRIADLEKKDGYVRRVVQIEFNAWHYHDTNLWASLAMRIFAELASALGGSKPGAAETKRRELHQKIRSSTARRDEAVERRDQALDLRARAVRDLEAKQAERNELQRESGRLRLQAAWKVICNQPEFAQLRTAANGLAEHFGITAAIHSAEDVRRLRQDIEQTGARAHGLLTAVGQRFQGVGGAARAAGILALVVASALALGLGVENAAKWLRVQLPNFSGTVVQVAALVSAVAAWCGRRVKEVRSALDTIAKVETELAAAERAVPETGKLAELHAQIEGLDKEIRKAGEELGAAEREIAEATAEIDRINGGGLVYDFLQERRTATSYVGQLGLISTIREDLDKLKALLADFEMHGNEPIERIILYVDDLDRCHPDKVVEVLQAVHLLLAFDLFNVVVGVDARWLERSLRRQYVGARDGEGARAGDGGDDPFSPQDYLEKIFQIPYALAPIDETGFKNLVGGLIETRTEWREKERKRSRDEAAKREASQRKALDDLSPKSQVEDAGLTEKRGGDERVEPPKKDELETPARDEPAPSNSVAPVLFFEDHEEEFIQQLHRFIDRPRLAKRFVNIYRLLRVRADDEEEGATFAASASSLEYRAALILLAVHVGHPKVAPKLVQALESAATGGTLAGILEGLEKGGCDVVACSEAERSEIGRIAAKLAPLGGRVPDSLDAYRHWAPRVACYSFDWHRAELLPRRVAR